MEADDIRYIKRAFKGMHIPFSLDLMNEIKSVENDFYGIGKDEYKEIWIKVPKPSYDEFRHIFLEEDNEATEQEIKENYEFEYSEEYYFHNLAFVKNRDGGQFLFIDKELNMYSLYSIENGNYASVESIIGDGEYIYFTYLKDSSDNKHYLVKMRLEDFEIVWEKEFISSINYIYTSFDDIKKLDNGNLLLSMGILLTNVRDVHL